MGQIAGFSELFFVTCKYLVWPSSLVVLYLPEARSETDLVSEMCSLRWPYGHKAISLDVFSYRVTDHDVMSLLAIVKLTLLLPLPKCVLRQSQQRSSLLLFQTVCCDNMGSNTETRTCSHIHASAQTHHTNTHTHANADTQINNKT